MKSFLRQLINGEFQKKISQDALARAIGISQATIHKILYTDTKHTLAVLQLCADYFQVPISQLYDSETASIGQKMSIPLRDIAEMRDNSGAQNKQNINQEPSTYNIDKYRVIGEVSEILDSYSEPGENFSVADDLVLAARVLESDTHYATALHMNIRSFAGGLEDLMQLNNVVQRLDDLETKTTLLQNENTVLQEDIRKLKRQHGGPAQCVTGTGYVAGTGTDGAAT